MPDNPDLVYLGRIVGVHGVRGWVKIHSECRPREAIFNYAQYLAQRGVQRPETLKLHDSRIQGKGLVAKFDGIDNRDHAYRLNGLALYVPCSALLEPDNNEYYWRDLIGLRVINQAGEALGTVSDIFETGANDVLVVRGENNGEILIPFVVPDYITDVDFPRQSIHVDWQRAWSAP